MFKFRRYLFLLFFFFAVSTSAESIVYVHFDKGYWQLWQMSADGQNRRPLIESNEDKRQPHWSPSGKQLIYRDCLGRLRLWNRSDQESKAILLEMGQITDARWADEDHLVLSRFGIDIQDDTSLWIVSLDGSEKKKIYEAVGLNRYPTVSRSGKFMVFVEGRGMNNHELWLLTIGSRQPRRLTNNHYYDLGPIFSPQDRWIAFEAKKTGFFEIYLKDIIDDRDIPLTHFNSYCGNATWSPDGKALAFSGMKDGAMNIWRVDRDGNNLRSLTFEGDSLEPDWGSE